MSSRRYSNGDNEYRVEILPHAWRQIGRACSLRRDVETGGVLIGHLSLNTGILVVTEAMPPPRDSLHGPRLFERGTLGLKEHLSERWSRNPQTYYVGEWHYHPASEIESSPDDRAQMEAIADDPAYNCPEPLMIIVGSARRRGQRVARLWAFPHGETVELVRESTSKEVSNG